MHRSTLRHPRLVTALLAVVLAGTASPGRAQVVDTAAAMASDSVSSALSDTTGVFIGYYRVTTAPIGLFGPKLRDERLPARWTDLSGRWWQRLGESLASARDTLWLGAHRESDFGENVQPVALAPDTIQYLPYNDVVDSTATDDSFLPGRVGQYADLGMLIAGRGELGGAWQRFEPCDAVGFNACNEGLVPRLRPDLQFGVLLGGTITDRIHVSVDYDQAREFDASNNINVYFQGLEDEILQRFEMGDVSITMPQSRYLGGGVPGGNFGFRALAEIGPVELQSVWAQQKGDIHSIDKLIDPRTGSAYEENSKTIDDHAYASGRFFFLVDPETLPGYPHIDVLALKSESAPESVRPRGETIELYRDEQLPPSQRDASRVFEAAAMSDVESEPVISGAFRRLDPSDYVVHSSGLWIVLRQPLGESEALALSYVTQSGDTVGTLNAGPAEAGAPAPELRLLRGPMSEHHPARSTWRMEMHQIYQIYAGELQAEDLEARIVLGQAAQGQVVVDYDGRQIPWLKVFGIDELSPTEQIDPQRLFRPSEQTGASSITGTYIVFPTLRPFADPPPTAELTAEQAEEALGVSANHRIYEERDPGLRSIGRFQLAVDYRVESDGFLSEIPLGSFSIREGSERITVDGVQLQRGTDYTVDYETGTVHLTNPAQLFGGRQSPRINATFEQGALFDIAPRSLFGTTARVRLGDAGELNLVGLYQNQRSVMARPELGNEPNSIMMGGITGDLEFGAGWMDRALDAVPALRLAGESSIAVNGELAMSLPDPNTRGFAYLDDFEATSETPIPMSQHGWRLGSRPGTTGALGALPGTLDPSNAFDLTWQHQAYARNGGTYGPFSAEKLDSMIITSGRDVPEQVLYMTMHEDPAAPRHDRVWRSITSVLSTRGSDLTSSEYLEFYAAESSEDVVVVLDLGSVSEDAFFFDAEGRTFGTRDGRPWGLGELDQEAENNQPWGRDLDVGLWNQACTTEPGRLTLLGDSSANCTVNNGINDTEDLNGDGVPNLEDSDYFRYVIPIGPNSPFLARDRHETGSVWRLYRVPLRGADAIAVNNADEETWRSVRQLRMTVTSGNCSGEYAAGHIDAGDPMCIETLLLARMRITGSTWKKREVEGMLTGLIGTDTLPGDYSRNVRVGPVSGRTDGNAYSRPPGTSNQASDPTQGYGASGVEVNEKGLRMAVTDLQPDARGEIFYRFPSESRNFMEYQELRLWALPRAGDWGPDGSLSLLVKIGTDDGNYYMYRTRLRPPIENRDVDHSGYWLPEIVVDFEDWHQLKAQAETWAVQNTAATDTFFWNEAGTHAIVLSSRAQAPNLAAIREMTFAIHNDAGLPADSAELWLNDLRLGGGRSETGVAGSMTVSARAADFGTLRLSFANQNAMFQPMNGDATLEGASDFDLNGRFELGHFAPAGWGLSMPVTVQHNREATAPEFLSRTDIRATDLEGLRETGASTTQVGIAVSKSTPAANPWVGLLLDGAQLSLNWRNADRDAFTQSNSTSQFNGAVAYRHQLRPRQIDVTPGFFADFLRAIAPAQVESSDFFRRATEAQLRWSPSDITLSTSYLDRKSSTLNYRSVIAGPADSATQVIRSPQRDLDNSAGIGFRPFESLDARFSVRSARDLLRGDELVATPFSRRAVEDARTDLAGLDVGWEKSRSLGTSIRYQPSIASWLRPVVGWSTDYSTGRTPHYLRFETQGDDTLSWRMERDFDVVANLERRIHFDPSGLARAAWGQNAAADTGSFGGLFRRGVRAILPLELTWTNERASSFERTLGEPDYVYRLGLHSLQSLRHVGADTAVTASSRNAVQLRGGFRMPLGLQLDATYVDGDRHAISQQGSDNVVTDRTWPDVRLGMSAMPIPEFMSRFLVRASANAGYRVQEGEHRFGNGLRTTLSRSIPMQFAATLSNGFTATYSGTFTSTEGAETTGSREGAERLHSVQLRAILPAPEWLGTSFAQPLTGSVGFTYTSDLMCSRRGAVDADIRCARTVDRLSRDVHFTLETVVNDLNVGTQFSLNQHQNFVGLQERRNEFRFAIFANFNMGVGVLPEGLGQNRMGF